ncbi:MAG: hypothetical protein J0I09_14415 [Sphingobacteriia bacterium]|nr:hypothetical protein [Sphingobacteriia bacterium]
MIAKPKKSRILSLTIIEKAIAAIDDKPETDQQVWNNVREFDLHDLLGYYQEIEKELDYQFNKRKADLVKINRLYITRERLYRILNPTIYLNAYTEKRANDAIYINANVGFIDEKGKVKNVVVFMGKSEETNLEKLKEKIESDKDFIQSAKRKVIEKLLSKIKIPEYNFQIEEDRRNRRMDAVPELSWLASIALEDMELYLQDADINSLGNDPEKLKKELVHTHELMKEFIEDFYQYKNDKWAQSAL